MALEAVGTAPANRANNIRAGAGGDLRRERVARAVVGHHFHDQLDFVLGVVEFLNNGILDLLLLRVGACAEADEPAHLDAVGVDLDGYCRGRLRGGYFGGGGFFGSCLFGRCFGCSSLSSRRLSSRRFGSRRFCSRGSRSRRGGATTSRNQHAGYDEQRQNEIH